MHSNRMRAVRNSNHLSAFGGGLHGPPPPGSMHPLQSRHPPPGAGTPSPKKEAPPREQAPPPARHAGIPPANRITDTCKNITFATSLQTVKMILILVEKTDTVTLVRQLADYNTWPRWTRSPICLLQIW